VKSIADNKTILTWLKGYKIPFVTKPCQVNSPSKNNFTELERGDMQVSINALIGKGAIELCSHEVGEFISPFFLVPKQNGENRFVLNLK